MFEISNSLIISELIIINIFLTEWRDRDIIWPSKYHTDIYDSYLAGYR